jgi:hypothetical protein
VTSLIPLSASLKTATSADGTLTLTWWRCGRRNHSKFGFALRKSTAHQIAPAPRSYFRIGEAILKQDSRQIISFSIHRGRTMIETSVLAAFVIAGLSLFALPTQSSAFSPEARQICTGHAFRLCSSEIPDLPRITACTIKQSVSLSAGCSAVVDRDLARQANQAASK